MKTSELRSFLGIRRMDKVLNAQIRELCGVMKGVDEQNDKYIFQWFGHVKRMRNYNIAKREYVREFAGSRSIGCPWKKWSDTIEDQLKRKRGLEIR